MEVDECNIIDFSSSIFSLFLLNKKGYINEDFTEKWISTIKKVTNTQDKLLQKSIDIAINFISCFAEIPEELIFKSHDQTLAIMGEDGTVTTKSLTSKPIDQHYPISFYKGGIYIPYCSPKSIRFSHQSIFNKFWGGKPLNPELKDFEEQEFREKLSPIRVVRIKNGDVSKDVEEGIYALDNRRLYLYKKLAEKGLVDTIPVRIVDINKYYYTTEVRLSTSTTASGDIVFIRNIGYEKFKLKTTQEKIDQLIENILENREIFSELSYEKYINGYFNQDRLAIDWLREGTDKKLIDGIIEHNSHNSQEDTFDCERNADKDSTIENCYAPYHFPESTMPLSGEHGVPEPDYT